MDCHRDDRSDPPGLEQDVAGSERPEAASRSREVLRLNDFHIRLVSCSVFDDRPRG